MWIRFPGGGVAMEDLEEKERDRLGTEWALVNAARELLNITLRREQPTTYRQAINFGAAIAPSVLAPDKRILRGVKESEEARYYAEMAIAESAATGRPISRLEYIEQEIAKFEKGISALPDESLTLMKGKLAILKRVRQEVKPKEYTENQLIIRDALKTQRKLPVSGEGTEYKEYQVDELRILRVRVLHPDPPEHKLGADLVYEFHELEDQTVRVASSNISFGMANPCPKTRGWSGNWCGCERLAATATYAKCRKQPTEGRSIGSLIAYVPSADRQLAEPEREAGFQRASYSTVCGGRVVGRE